MKNITTTCIRALVLSSLLATAGFASAQSTQVTTTTTSQGTISSFSPTTMTVRTVSSPAPVAYAFDKTTTYVDEDGNPVSVETVKSGAPVTVFYTQDGDRMVASKVVVRRTITTTSPTPAPAPEVIEKKTSTTTTTTTGQP